MTRVKVVGAGSIGNHLTQAARRLGWSAVVTDRDPEALTRMRRDIYPNRYGEWDEAIELQADSDVRRGGFDVIFIGTPPESHLPLALEAVQEKPRVVVIEKPLCPPDLGGAREVLQVAEEFGVRLLVGFDHAVGRAARLVEELLGEAAVGQVLTIDVEFREHWEGILAAHPWLTGPADSYLGYWRRGGGASGEHSHATHLWQHFAHAAGGGRVTDVTAALKYVADPPLEYDEIMWAALRTASGLFGTVIQDVVTRPARKRARLQGERGAIEWIYGASPEGDAVRLDRPGQESQTFSIERERPDDFLEEMLVVESILGGAEGEALSYHRGVDTMLVLAAAHRAEAERRQVQVEEVERDLWHVTTRG